MFAYVPLKLTNPPVSTDNARRYLYKGNLKCELLVNGIRTRAIVIRHMNLQLIKFKRKANIFTLVYIDEERLLYNTVIINKYIYPEFRC